MAGGGRHVHYFGAATDAARLLLRSTAEDVAATASGKQRLAVRAVIAGVECNVPRGRFWVPSPANEDADPSLSKDAATGARRGLYRAGRGGGMGHR